MMSGFIRWLNAYPVFITKSAGNSIFSKKYLDVPYNDSAAWK